jgi:hypothetical protein
MAMQGRTVSGFLIAVWVAIGLVWTGCRRESYSTDPADRLEASADTLLFDTVFASVGSITLPVRILNPHEEGIRIDRIFLASGAQSAYRINADGIPGPEISGLELSGGDSLWVFVEVTVDPDDSTLPFVVEDELLVEYNGNVLGVQLVTWGRNAHFHGGIGALNALPCEAVWENDLPHVVYGIVEVEPSCLLTIEAGTQVHVHPKGGILVNQGTLRVEGSLGSEVVFQGDRLEEDYQDIPGSWGIGLDVAYETEFGVDQVTLQRGGIWLYGSVDSRIDYAILKNGTIGLQVDTVGLAGANSLTLTNTRIYNMSATGLLAQGAVIDGYNNLIYDCGMACAAFTVGGRYRMEHCTFGNYWAEGIRSSPAVFITDWYEAADGSIQERSVAGSRFTNCIVWGNNAELDEFDELICDLRNPPASSIFRYCAVDVDDVLFPVDMLLNCQTNDAPPFVSTSDRDFHLASNSGAWDGSTGSFLISTDLDGLPRAVGLPDKGCFERQP